MLVWAGILLPITVADPNAEPLHTQVRILGTGSKPTDKPSSSTPGITKDKRTKTNSRKTNAALKEDAKKSKSTVADQAGKGGKMGKGKKGAMSDGGMMKKGTMTTVKGDEVTPNPSPTKIPATTQPSSISSSIPSDVSSDLATSVPTAGVSVTAPAMSPLSGTVFVGSNNVLVTYESTSVVPSANTNQTLAVVDLTCEFIVKTAVLPLGAVDFACVWFPYTQNNSSVVEVNDTNPPIQLIYDVTAAFLSSSNTFVTTEQLNAAIIQAFDDPTELVTALDVLPAENPFSVTTALTAAPLTTELAALGSMGSPSKAVFQFMQESSPSAKSAAPCPRCFPSCVGLVWILGCTVMVTTLNSIM